MIDLQKSPSNELSKLTLIFLKNLAKQNDKNLQAILENETLCKVAITFGVAIANSNGISQYFSEKYYSLVSFYRQFMIALLTFYTWTKLALTK